VAASDRPIPIRFDASNLNHWIQIEGAEMKEEEEGSPAKSAPARAALESTAALLRWSATAMERWTTCFRGRRTRKLGLQRRISSGARQGSGWR
jgi:hypothetical protein